MIKPTANRLLVKKWVKFLNGACPSYQVQFFKRDLNITSCKFTPSSTLQSAYSHILYHPIIVASFVCKGSRYKDKRVIL